MAFPCGRRGGGWASLSCLATSCVACFFLCVVVCRGEPQPQDQLPVKSYAYASFQPNNSLSTLRLLKDAGINGGALQLTRDGFRAHRSGSVLLYEAFTLWRSLEDESSGPSSDPAAATAASGRNGTGQDQRVRVVSFNSTFSMSFAYCDRALPGEGLAFLIAPSSAGPPPGSHDGFLGLTNATFEASPARNQFVAVEFDMVKQSYDPSDNHVGLDIGTVVSNKTANLADFNITIVTDDMVSATNYTVWIEYDGVARHIWVYMDVRGKQKPASPVLDAPLDLSKHVPGQSYVGFSGSTGATVGLNSILDWTLTVETFPEKKNGELIFWIFYAVFWLLMIIFMATQCTKCIRQLQEEEVRHERRQEWLRHTLSNLPGMPTEFQYEELEKATEKFNEEQSQRWTGGYAPGTVVYKGLLSTKDGWSEAMEVAVKSYNFGRLDEEFHYFGNEIKTNNLLRHQNIVPIIGWCYKYVPRGTWTSLYQVFKYEHLSNGSLEQHLFRRDAHVERPALSWGVRYGIVTDVALALHYMHHEHSSLVLHRDIKPSNVMLDAFFRARLSEFGMARVVEPNRSSFADGAVAGTRGYIAPEYSAGREATRRTDVFAFGTLMLEVVTGRHALLNDDPACPLLSDWVWRLHGRSTLLGAVEQSLGIAEFDEYEARRLLLLGMACSSPNPCARPTMPQVLQILSKSAPPPEVPLLKPTFMWPPEEDTTNDTFDESFRILAPANNSQDFFPLLSSGR